MNAAECQQFGEEEQASLAIAGASCSFLVRLRGRRWLVAR
jgi:hypothetical protein